MQKKVSVIIPCYNVDGFLNHCWESLHNQTIGIENMECIFVNDASNDNELTLNKLKDIEKKYPDSVLAVNLDKNVGPGGARNIGLEYASGKYIQFLDADDELRLDACEKLYNLAERYSSDLIQFNHLYVLGKERRSSNNSRISKTYHIKNREERIPFLTASKVTYGCTNKFYKKELIDRVGSKFPEKLRYEEPLFVYPIFLYVKSITLLNEALYIYKFRDGSMVTSQLGKKLLDHAQVQLMLLEDCMKRENYNDYKEIIEIYFLWSFYCETIAFSAEYSDSFLPVDFYKYMQKICKTFFPDWRSNQYINLIPNGGIRMLDGLDIEFDLQYELDKYIAGMKGMI
ncbi:glycosyltransferase family 2 protein [Lachnospiraceae bacterium C1.1]|nr:glycosyltransferase family 2 protein [Lachnospiraceae bacterium C1.1]